MQQIETSEKKLIYCNQCKSETQHSLHGSHMRRREYKYGNLVTNQSNAPITDWDEFDVKISKMWVCLGCEQSCLEIIYTDSSMIDRDGNQEYDEQVHPARVEFYVNEKHFSQLPSKLIRIYREVLLSFNNQLNLLCAIGLRVLLEGICADKQINGKDLKTKIDGLSSVLPPNIVSNLHSLRFIGNEAAHEMNAPKLNELRLAIEISEDLLNYLYELGNKTRYLNQIFNERKASEDKT